MCDSLGVDLAWNQMMWHELEKKNVSHDWRVWVKNRTVKVELNQIWEKQENSDENDGTDVSGVMYCKMGLWCGKDTQVVCNFFKVYDGVGVVDSRFASRRDSM